MSSAVYAGTFDPFTNGHLDIVERSLKVFDHVVVLLATSPSKTPLFSIDQRESMLVDLFKDHKNIVVDKWGGLLVEYCRKNKISNIVRGLRPTGDFESEFQMASMNHKLYDKIDTIFLPTNEDNFYVSSSLVREIFHHGGDVSDFLPKNILKELKKRKS